MIENLLRAPGTRAEAMADAVRIAGCLSVVAAFIWHTPSDAGILAVTLPVLGATRLLGVSAGFDLLCSGTVLVAAWSNVLDLYRTVAGWDIVMHFSCTALLAPLVYLLFARFGIVADPDAHPSERRASIVLVPVIGLAISAFWEMIEWFGYVFITREIFVEYHDTIGDMVAGALGALLAGALLTVPRIKRSVLGSAERVLRAPSVPRADGKRNPLG